MQVFWLEQGEADVPLDDEWLTAGEQERLVGLRFPKRRSDWRLGRWTTKLAVATHLGAPADRSVFSDIEVRTCSSGAPEVLVHGERPGITISLSHRSGVAVCALASSQSLLGCDLELVEPRSDAFISDYFTAEERELICANPSAEERSAIAALLWSAKESALKALCVGLRADTHSVRVKVCAAELVHSRLCLIGSDSIWAPLQVVHRGSTVFAGWWRGDGKFLRTVVHAEDAAPPIPMKGFGTTALPGPAGLHTVPLNGYTVA